MWIIRDFEHYLAASSLQPVRIVTGPRQCGKSSLLRKIASPTARFISLDDLSVRTTAQKDPALLIGDLAAPLIIDEAQYAPELFPELKRRVDEAKYHKTELPLIWVTGSNRFVLNQRVRESLAGRASYRFLHSCSVSELARSALFSSEIFLRGGWPELYVRRELDAPSYLDDFIRTYVEKDIILTAGVQKTAEFGRALQLLAGRTGCQLNLSEVGSQAGVRSSTLDDWLSLLEENSLVSRIQPYHSNHNKRLVKTPVFYFNDCALAARLQGWRTLDPLLVSPQVGRLFETLVYGELLRIRDHRFVPLEVFYFRTKEGDELDFLVKLETGRGIQWLAIEAKYASQAASGYQLPKSLITEELPIVAQWVVTFSGEERMLPGGGEQVPIQRLANKVVEICDSP